VFFDQQFLNVLPSRSLTDIVDTVNNRRSQSAPLVTLCRRDDPRHGNADIADHFHV